MCNIIEWLWFTQTFAGVAGSISAVYSRHMVLASRTFRETNFLISLPIPRCRVIHCVAQSCFKVYNFFAYFFASNFLLQMKVKKKGHISHFALLH
jgi:hypothetical protein